ncbi:MAG: hypothetical protein AB7T37_09375 [Dehalococcoidia bacterium]
MLEVLLMEARRRESIAAEPMMAHRMELEALRQVDRLETQLVRARARAATIPAAISA